MKWLLNRAALLLCGGTLAYASAPLWRLLGGNAVWTIWTITLLSNVDWLRRYLRQRQRRERRVISVITYLILVPDSRS